MKKLHRKGYSRLYCENRIDIPNIRGLLKEFDQFEFEYMPEKWITTSDEYPKVVYTGKFDDLDIDEFTAFCWKNGFRVWIFDAGEEDYPISKVQDNKR